MHVKTDGWLNNVEIVESPHFNERPCSVDTLIIHNISLPPRQFGSAFIKALFTGRLNPNIHEYFATIAHLQVSAHFLIERNGAIVQFVSTGKRAWHAGVSSFLGRENCNDFSIGIELNGCDLYPYTLQQYQSLTKLTHALMKFYPALTSDRITGHENVAPKRKTDPSDSFNWNFYRKLLKTNS